MLNEKLSYFVANAENPTNISLYHAKLATSITFIESKMKLFLNLNKAQEITIIGIEFSKKEKNICKFEWERVK